MQYLYRELQLPGWIQTDKENLQKHLPKLEQNLGPLYMMGILLVLRCSKFDYRPSFGAWERLELDGNL